MNSRITKTCSFCFIQLSFLDRFHRSYIREFCCPGWHITIRKWQYPNNRNLSWFDAAYYCNARSKRDALDTVYIYTSISGTVGENCVMEGLSINMDAGGYRLPTEAEWEYACRSGKLPFTGEQPAYRCRLCLDQIKQFKYGSSGCPEKAKFIQTL